MAAPESPFKPGILCGKVALITGGGSGIGLEITRQLGAPTMLPRSNLRSALPSCALALSGRTLEFELWLSALSWPSLCFAPLLSRDMPATLSWLRAGTTEGVHSGHAQLPVHRSVSCRLLAPDRNAALPLALLLLAALSKPDRPFQPAPCHARPLQVASSATSTFWGRVLPGTHPSHTHTHARTQPPGHPTSAGLHGASVVISGRREQVLRDACAALGAEGITAHFVQVGADWGNQRAHAHTLCSM